jgi:protein-tyrosine phosphatase
MVDLHTHILPGIDDGARTLEDALGMARAALADGIRVVAATPHVRDDHPRVTIEAVQQGVAELREALTAAALPLDVRPGGEVALDRLELLSPEEIAGYALAGNAGYLLLEFPYYGWPLALETRVRELAANGVILVVAHPERNADVQAVPERLCGVVEAGALVQVTAASVDGRSGRRSREAAFDLIERNLAHMIASDAHTPDLRGIGMSEAAAAVGDAVLARWLTHDVPGAIVAGAPIPERPAAAHRRRLFRRSP